MIAILFTAAVLIVTLQGQGGLMETKLFVEGRHRHELMGAFVAGAGDVDADGMADLLVGAPGVHERLGQRGAVLVLSGVDGRLLQTFYGRTDAMWIRAAAAGDVDGDGHGDVLLGAPWANSSPTLPEAGAVVLFSGRTGDPIFQFRGTNVQGWFGDAIAAAGDVNADGIPDLMVGERGANGGAYHGAGAAHVYSGADGALLFSFDGANPGDFFGSQLGAAGDVDADGHGDLLLFATRADPNGLSEAGSVFVHSGADGRLLYSYHGNCPSAYLDFGVGIGDVDVDGHDDFLLGAGNAGPNGQRGYGAAYVYSGATGALLHEFLGTAENATLGGWVGGGTDQDGDGRPDFFYMTYLSVRASIHWISGATMMEFFRMDEPSLHAMGSAALAGDTDGDGPAEMIFGNEYYDRNGVAWTGAIKVVGMDPLLRASQHEISLAAGGTVRYDLDFPDSFGGGGFQILGSSHGTGEARFDDLSMPLIPDDFYRRTLHGHYGPYAANFRGQLDALGRAQAVLAIPANGLPARLVGKTIFLAAAGHDVSGQSLSSIPLALQFAP